MISRLTEESSAQMDRLDGRAQVPEVRIWKVKDFRLGLTWLAEESRSCWRTIHLQLKIKEKKTESQQETPVISEQRNMKCLVLNVKNFSVNYIRPDI